MVFSLWPWYPHGIRRPHRRQPHAILNLETLEDRLALSTVLPTHEDWRQERFTVDDVTVANGMPLADIGQQSTQGVQADGSSFGSLIHLGQAQTSYPYRGDGYTVAVIDTGIDYNDTALGGGWGKRVIAGYDFVNNDSDPMDDNGHGTHVAGIIGSSDATYGGVAPDVKFVALKVLDSTGTGSFGNVDLALKWVADHQAQYNIVAVNLSLGSGNYTVNPYTFLESDFSTLKSEGVFIAVASGNGFYTNNSAQGLAYPAISSQVVSVGAVWTGDFGKVTWASGAIDYTTAADRITSFTQRGTALDLLAPGALITSTYLNNTFQTMAGTSMASPVVAGAAAILHQALDSTGHHSQANEDYILSLMQSTGVTVNDGDDENDNVTNTGLNFKRLDLLAALNGITPVTTNAPPTLSPIANQTVPAGQSIVVTLSATDPNGDPISYSATVVGGGSSSQAYSLDQSLGLNYAGSYYQNMYGANEKWMIGAANTWYYILPNGELHQWNGQSGAAFSSSPLIATLDASFYADPSLLWNAQPGTTAPAKLSISGNKLTIQVPSSYKGTFSVQATASDGSLSASQTFTVTSTNVAPVLNPIANQNLSAGQSATVALSATDANGDPITFSARVVSGTPSTPAATLTISGNQLTVKPPAGFTGSFVVEVTASDGSLSAKQSFTVNVATTNAAPVLSPIPTQTVTPGQTLTVPLTASDPNGDKLTFSARVVSGTPKAPNVAFSFSGSQMTIKAPAGFKGSFVVEVTVSDGRLTAKQSFTVNVANVAPNLKSIANQSLAAGKSLVVPLSASDANGDALTYSARVIGTAAPSQAYTLKTQLGLAYSGSYMTGLLGAREKWLAGKGGQWYLIFPSGQLRHWAGTLNATLSAANLVATLGVSYYNDPSLLWNAKAPTGAPATVSLSGSNLTIQAPAGYKGSFTVEVAVSDGSLKATQSFSVTVGSAASASEKFVAAPAPQTPWIDLVDSLARWLIR